MIATHEPWLSGSLVAGVVGGTETSAANACHHIGLPEREGVGER